MGSRGLSGAVLSRRVSAARAGLAPGSSVDSAKCLTPAPRSRCPYAPGRAEAGLAPDDPGAPRRGPRSRFSAAGAPVRERLHRCVLGLRAEELLLEVVESALELIDETGNAGRHDLDGAVARDPQLIAGL